MNREHDNDRDLDAQERIDRLNAENRRIQAQNAELEGQLQNQAEHGRARFFRNSGFVILAVAGGLLGGILISRGCNSEGSGVVVAPISTPVGDKLTPVTTPVVVVTRVVETPVATATAIPTATQIPSGQRESAVDHEMKAGETYKAQDGSMIKGDVLVNGVRLFDDNERTGLIVELHEAATITAPWGANVSLVGMDQTTRNAVFGQGVEEMKAKGCVNGCDRVDVVKYPGGKPQGK